MTIYKVGQKVTASLPISGLRGKRIEIKGTIKSVRGSKRPLYTIVDGQVQREFVVYNVK